MTTVYQRTNTFGKGYRRPAFDGDLARPGAGPADVELAECLGLLEGDRGLLEQLEQRQEPGHDHQRRVGVGHQRAERAHPFAAQP